MPGSENNTQYSAGYRINPTGAQEAFLMQRAPDSVSLINSETDPNGVHVANPGSIAFARDGNWWRKETGMGNTGWVMNNDLYITPYIVDLNGLPGSSYSTIQSAIDAAVADGATSSVFKIIFIRPGTYAEDLDIYPGIILWGSGERAIEGFPIVCRIDGEHILIGENLFLQTANLEFYNNSTGVDTFTRSASEVNQSLYCKYTDFFNGSSSSVVWEGNNGAFTDPNSFSNCQFIASSSHLIFTGDLDLIFNDCGITLLNIECTTCVMHDSYGDPGITATDQVDIFDSSINFVAGTCDAFFVKTEVLSPITTTGIVGYDYLSGAGLSAFFDGSQSQVGQSRSMHGNTYTPIRSATNVTVIYANGTAPNYVGITDTSASRTVTIPVATSFVNRSLTIKDESLAASPTNTITLTATGGSLIEGLSSLVLDSPGACVEVVSNGTAYFILNQYP